MVPVMAGQHWSDEENDLIVKDYFSMLYKELAGKKYNKTEHRNALQKNLDRTKGSIEYKHQNISAIVRALGQPWIDGYTPATNVQEALVNAVHRYFVQHKSKISALNASSDAIASHKLQFKPPPTLQNTKPPENLEATQSLARKFDVAARDERNQELGIQGERCVLCHEKTVLTEHGREDLARQVKWISQAEGDGAGYDIESFTPEGHQRLIEVKTTNGWEYTPFYISRNELEVADRNRNIWVLHRVWNFAKQPMAFELQPPLDRHVELIAVSYRASLR